jgi:hypothetical protein
LQPIHVLTNRYGNSRIGVNLAETKLNVANVNDSGFGKLFTRSVDGDLYAQPLLVSGMTIGGTTRNVVFLATSRNTVYAYDADDPEACLPLWSRNLGTPVPRDDIFKQLGQYNDHYLNFGGEIGITSTPAIDLRDGSGLLYVVAKTREISGLGGGVTRAYRQKIHALDLATGEHAAIPNNPMEIQASAPRSDGETIRFDSLFQLNRPGLLLLNGVLYLAFGSHTDIGEFYGWIMAYDAATLAQLAVYNTAPDWGEGGIWQSGCGLASDSEGHVYAVVGNGEKPSTYHTSNRGHLVPDVARPGSIDEPAYGNCILKLKLKPPSGEDRRHTLEVEDWYMAPDVLDLNEIDNDLMSGPVIFETSGDGAQKLVLGGGKDGRFYLLDRENLGHWSPLIGGTPSRWGVPQPGAHIEEVHVHHHGAEPPPPMPAAAAPPQPAAAAPPRWIPWKNGQRPRNAVQDDQLCIYHIHGAPIIWKRSFDSAIIAFVWSEKDALRAFRFRKGKFVDDRSGGFALLLLKLGDARGLPSSADKNTFIVADVGGQLHFRIIEDVGEEVDKDGKHIPKYEPADPVEGALAGREEEIKRLKARLDGDGLWPPAQPTADDVVVAIITAGVAIAFPNRADPTTSAYRFPQDEMRMPGGFLALSADGDKDGTAIVWASHPTDDDAMNKVVKGTLRAYDARDLRKKLWDSDQDAYGSDRVGNFAKNVCPVVANSKVYLATFSRELVVYGLYSDIGARRIIEAAGIFEFRRFGVDGRCAASCDRYDLSAAGGSLRGKADSFVFAYKPIDLGKQPRITITARLSGINTIPTTANQPEARAGIMIRKFDDAGNVGDRHYVALLVTAGKNGAIGDNDLIVQRRNDPKKPSKETSKGKRRLPIWLRLACEKAPKDNRFRFRSEVSDDGATWTSVDEEEMTIDGRVLVGLAAASQADPKAEDPPKVQARFTNVLITPAT